jgi:ABC-type transporter Mla MlaB component
MAMQYNIKTEADASASVVTLVLNGKFGEDALPQLEVALSDAKNLHATVYLDLSEVTLVDRKAVEYLSSQAARNVKLVNCPVYLLRWIKQGSENAEN